MPVHLLFFLGDLFVIMKYTGSVIYIMFVLMGIRTYSFTEAVHNARCAVAVTDLNRKVKVYWVGL